MSIFDLSRGSGKGKPQKKRETQVPILAESTDDVIQKLQKMQEKHTKLVGQIEEIFQKSGVDPKELERYCENPSNFTPIQWTRVQERKEEIETSITGMSRENLRKSKDEKAKTQVTKERRGKTLGSRKKWLDMH